MELRFQLFDLTGFIHVKRRECFGRHIEYGIDPGDSKGVIVPNTLEALMTLIVNQPWG